MQRIHQLMMAALIPLLTTAQWQQAQPTGADDAGLPIDRQSVVTRNNPHVTSADPLSSLTVGNGAFAATVDITGLQSYPGHYRDGVPLCTMSQWGWHTFDNDSNLIATETQRPYNLHGRESIYAVEVKTDGRGKDATAYYRANPHRLNLGTVGIAIRDAQGQPIAIDHIQAISQELKLWDGMIESRYRVDGHMFDVSTAVLGDKDCIFSRIHSDMLQSGRSYVTIRFPYPTGRHSDDASATDTTGRTSITIVDRDNNHAVAELTIGQTIYYTHIQWEGDCHLELMGNDGGYIKLSTDDEQLSFAVEYLPERPDTDMWTYSYDQARKAVTESWQTYWRTGGIVDFGLCTDPRAAELERRTILSQYLTRVNCASAIPPQETGLTYNSWFGRPHLEMTWWHSVDFALWGHPEVLAGQLEWYNTTAYPEAVKIARRQNFDGARWMKMTDPWAGEAPSNVGSFLIWQQPHYIYFAEEMYRAYPGDETLRHYGKYVDETARFMADYAKACAPTEGPIKLYGHTAMQESMSKDFSYNHPFEQAYWLYGLKTAQLWRERQGLPRDAEWDSLIGRISPLAADSRGIYTAGDKSADADISDADFMLKSRSDHPAVLGACGLLPDTTLYDRATMAKTLRWVMDNWNWETTWGWDYGMIAMAAARLGQPQTAVDALLIDKGKNTYLTNGHNYQEPTRLRLYLPGNGALLDAVAMMCAGWTGSQGHNPGFPSDGTWQVRWEGLKPIQ